MKLEKKWVVAAGILPVVLVITLICLFIYFSQRKPLIAFYGLSDREAAAVQASIGDAAEFTTFDTETSLYFQAKEGRKPDIIITTSGNGVQTAQDLAAKKSAVPAELIAGMTSSIRSGVTRANETTIAAVPLLSSHFEVDIHLPMLRSTAIKTVATWNDIEAFATAAKDGQQAFIMFAGKDGATMIDLLGALTEALHGRSAYENAVQTIEIELDKAQKIQSFNADAVAQALVGSPDAPLYDAGQLLKKWNHAGLLNKDSFAMGKETLMAYMKANLASVVFMSLSDHRAIDRTIIEPYTSIYFPSDAVASSRNFTAPIIYAVPFTSNKKVFSLLQTLVSVEAQENLSRATGLAPVLANCRTPDLQADDARYWVAATNAPLAGLSREAALSDTNMQALGVALSILLRN